MADRPRAPRVWVRWLPFPSERGEPPAREPMAPVTGTDGKVREGDYLRRSLGLPSTAADSEDYGVTWSRWPPP